ncbi:MAG: hypothetical protein WC428_08080 [Candidatus Paceibacterota bacterium]
MDSYYIGYKHGDEKQQFKDNMLLEAVDLIDAFTAATEMLKDKFEIFYIDCICKEDKDEYLFN